MVFVSGGKWSLSMVANGLCQWWQMVFVSPQAALRLHAVMKIKPFG
jgi:hypothetical protein